MGCTLHEAHLAAAAMVSHDDVLEVAALVLVKGDTYEAPRVAALRLAAPMIASPSRACSCDVWYALRVSHETRLHHATMTPPLRATCCTSACLARQGMGGSEDYSDLDPSPLEVACGGPPHAILWVSAPAPRRWQRLSSQPLRGTSQQPPRLGSCRSVPSCRG